MFGCTPKYRRTSRDPFSGIPLYWSAHPDGFPVRADTAPAVVERARLPEATVTFDADTRVLELPRDLKEYVKIQDWLANGCGVLRFEERTPDKDKSGVWHVLISWVNVRGHLPGPSRLQTATADALPATDKQLAEEDRLP